MKIRLSGLNRDLTVISLFIFGLMLLLIHTQAKARSENSVLVPIKGYFNDDAIAGRDDRTDYDMGTSIADGWGESCLEAGELPEEGVINVNGIPFQWPGTAAGQKNNLRPSGEEVFVPAGKKLKYIHILAASQYYPAEHKITLKKEKRESEDITFSFSGIYSAKPLFNELPGLNIKKLNASFLDAGIESNANIWHAWARIPGRGTVNSINLPSAPEWHIFAVTLTENQPDAKRKKAQDSDTGKSTQLNLSLAQKDRILDSNDIPEIHLKISPPIYPQTTALVTKVSGTDGEDLFFWRDNLESKRKNNKPLKKEWNITHKVPQRYPGFYEFTSVLFEDRTPVEIEPLSYCMTTIRSEPDARNYTWGTTIPPGLSPEEAGFWVQQASEAGLSWIQVQIDFNRIYTGNNKGKWTEIDLYLDTLGKYNLNPIPVFCGLNPYLLNNDSENKIIGTFISDIAGHFGNNTGYWKIGLKPASGSWRGNAARFSRFAAGAAELIHNINSDALIICGDVSIRDTAWIRDMLAAGDDWIDIFSLEPEPGTLGPAEADLSGQIRHIQALLFEYETDADLWLTDLGWLKNDFFISPEENDLYVWTAQSYYIASSYGIRAIGLAGLRDSDIIPGSTGKAALFDLKINPRKMLLAHLVTSNFLQNKDSVEALPVVNEHYGYIVKKGANEFRVAWKNYEKDSRSGVSIASLPVIGQQALTMDLAGALNQIDVLGRRITFSLGREPLVLSGDFGPARFIEPIFDFQQTEPLAPDTDTPVNLKIFNPLEFNIGGSLIMSPPLNWKLTPNNIRFNIPKTQVSRYKIFITPEEGTKPGFYRIPIYADANLDKFRDLYFEVKVENENEEITYNQRPVNLIKFQNDKFGFLHDDIYNRLILKEPFYGIEYEDFPPGNYVDKFNGIQLLIPQTLGFGNNVVSCAGQKIELPETECVKIFLLLAACSEYPDLEWKKIYTDNSGDSSAQGVSDWRSTAKFGEREFFRAAGCAIPGGIGICRIPASLRLIELPVNSAKTLRELQLPIAPNVKIFSLTLALK